MAQIGWTDALGAAVLENGWGVIAGRFSSWTTESPGVGPVHTRLSDGARRRWTYRRDYMALFDLTDIPASALPLIDRLARHLDAQGLVSVTTNDVNAAFYPTCGLAPDADLPWGRLTNARELRYTASFALLNLAALPGPMLCQYEA